jgi:phosphopantothenoylcysteine decarboxylase / phosphopantothenate---cysteine ligase
VSASVAAYKAVLLARLLIRAGASVQPVLTRSATRFVGKETLAGLTGQRVQVSMFGVGGEPHVELGATSDLIVVAPATADLLARAAHGRADDLVSATLLCARCPVLLAPAMHPRMWAHPMTQANVERLKSVPGWSIVGPAYGEVASGDQGLGRLVEPELLLAAITESLVGPSLTGSAERAATDTRRDLEGRRIVITAGPTVEDLDPVRSLSNRSSGKMGFALAASAAARGAAVRLIAGPVNLATPAGVQRLDVRSALDMQKALQSALGVDLQGADALVMCAAVADYRPRQQHATKLKRGAGVLSLELVPNPDLLAEIGAARGARTPLLVGFAVESLQGQALVDAARIKLASKRVDAIVANYSADALGTDDTRAVLVTAESERWLGPGPKREVADDILTFVAGALRAP